MKNLPVGFKVPTAVVMLGEVGCGDVDRNRWRALVNSVLNLRVP
jgi:siroheme synthase (precorrin-2 oxidase/ferrochelatase)